MSFHGIQQSDQLLYVELQLKLAYFTGLEEGYQFICIVLSTILLFHSHIMYGIESYSSATSEKIAELQILRNKAIRNLFGSVKGTSNYKIQNNISPERYLIRMNLVIQTHNIIHNNLKSNTKLNMNNNSHNYNTRTSNHLKLNIIKTSRYGKDSELQKAKSEYNEIPESFKSLTKYQFKCENRKYFFDVFKSSKIV